MLLKMDLVNGPKIKLRISHNFSEFFYILPAYPGRLWQSQDGVYADENQVGGKVVGTVSLREQYRIGFR